MPAISSVLLSASLMLGGLLGIYETGKTESMEKPVVRLAELEIDPNQTQAYQAALKEEIETSIRSEPGVLTLYAVSLKEHPTQIRIFERYASRAAYEAHLQSAHFQKYKRETQNMVSSLRLIETDPIYLGSKGDPH